MNVVLANCAHINEWNEIIIRHNTFTKLRLLYKTKTNSKLHWKLCERKVWVFFEDKIEREKLKLYWKCKVTFILKQLFWLKWHSISKGGSNLLSVHLLVTYNIMCNFFFPTWQSIKWALNINVSRVLKYMIPILTCDQIILFQF